MSKYLNLNFYIIETFETKISTIAHFKREIYVIDNFRAKLFINTNIFKFETIVVNVVRKKLIVNNYNIIAFLFVILRRKRVERKLYS